MAFHRNRNHAHVRALGSSGEVIADSTESASNVRHTDLMALIISQRFRGVVVDAKSRSRRAATPAARSCSAVRSSAFSQMIESKAPIDGAVSLFMRPPLLQEGRTTVPASDPTSSLGARVMSDPIRCWNDRAAALRLRASASESDATSGAEASAGPFARSTAAEGPSSFAISGTPVADIVSDTVSQNS